MSPDFDHLSKENIALMRDTILWIMIRGYAKFPLERVVHRIHGEPISQSTSTEGSIPVIGGGAKPSYYTGKANHEGQIITIAHQGTAGFVNWWDEPIFLASSCFGLEPNDSIMLPKYLFHVLKNMEHRIMGMRYGNTVPAVSWGSISRIEIIIPPVSKQKEVLDGLEAFENITNDRCGELVRLIEENHKRYEYVRDAIFGALGEMADG